MSYHFSPREHSSKPLLAFLIGAMGTLIVGGYYLFGPKGSQHRTDVDRLVKRTKFQILDKLQQIENVTEVQYYKIVDEVVRQQGRLRGIGAEKLHELSENFRMRWDEMKELAHEARDEAEKELREEEKHLMKNIEKL